MATQIGNAGYCGSCASMPMRIGFFTSIEEWGGSETYLKSLMLGVREHGHIPVLFGIRGTRLWDEMAQAGVLCVAWSEASVQSGLVSKLRFARDPRRGTGVPPVAREGCKRDACTTDGLRDKLGRQTSNESTLAQRRFSRAADQRISLGRCLARMAPMWVKLLAGNMKEVHRLASLFRQNPVDVMHVSVSGYEVAGLACRRAGIPTAAMNMITPPEERYWLRRSLMRYTQRRYDHVSSQSQYCTDRWVSFARLPHGRCSHVWNGADLDRYHPNPDRLARVASDRFRVISIGRLHPMKGYLHLVDALEKLEDEDITLAILGDGAQREELEKQIQRAGLGDRISLPGFREDPEKELARADCFVLPSVSHESCPAVLAEAMACGLPLITSDFGPLAEVNVHGETGLVVPAGRPEVLAEAITKLKADPTRCEAMGKAGRRRAQLFSRNRMVEKTIGLYRTVVPK